MSEIKQQDTAKGLAGQQTAPNKPWSWQKKFGFRLLFIFFLAMSIPFSANWYKNVFTLDWSRPHYRDLYDIARFQPSFLSLFGGQRSRDITDSPSGDEGTRKNGPKKNKTENGTVKKGEAKNESAAGLPPKRSFLADYADWGIALLFALAGALIWTAIGRKSKSYHILYYWIRVVVRYRAGIGIIGFGFTKLFPTQMPYPSLGLLNSNFGDFTAQKIYWLSVGVVPWYQVFGGVVEIAAGAMLFFRKTTTFGAILLAAALGDITFVNYAYDGGVHVYAFYFVILALFLAADDFPKLYNLLILERHTVPFRIYPDFRKPWLKYSRITLKLLTFVIFFGVLTYTEIINFKYDPYKQPATAGVKKLRGNYHVSEFKINGELIPFNPLDSTRWQEATFENWTTLTFKINRPVLIDPSNGGGSPMRDIQRTFEISGVAGGQRAFHYYADTVDKVLYLQDKNVMALRGGRKGADKAKEAQPKEDNWISKTAWQHIGDENKMIDKAAWSTRRDREFEEKPREVKRHRMVLKYDTTDGSRVILSGINERKDSIYVVLDRYDRKYVLPKSSLNAGKY
ncbi:hypothetical protein QF042_001987 [Pedobacter sp. W3I1]|uniref:hypothetical protein n=1 Tax=Pedobacter sp. W3I1 TaxID=3042291 RepID=UPI0027807E14|nr:hypothetical protein [Pedobacter sp. W3I1]MDQ0638422.1 hypothetical protein [Pedobacter sp. W3I1]